VGDGGAVGGPAAGGLFVGAGRTNDAAHAIHTVEQGGAVENDAPDMAGEGLTVESLRTESGENIGFEVEDVTKDGTGGHSHVVLHEVAAIHEEIAAVDGGEDDGEAASGHDDKAEFGERGLGADERTVLERLGDGARVATQERAGLAGVAIKLRDVVPFEVVGGHGGVADQDRAEALMASRSFMTPERSADLSTPPKLSWSFRYRT
jgi:hypothetical protein